MIRASSPASRFAGTPARSIGSLASSDDDAHAACARRARATPGPCRRRRPAPRTRGSRSPSSTIARRHRASWPNDITAPIHEYCGAIAAEDRGSGVAVRSTTAITSASKRREVGERVDHVVRLASLEIGGPELPGAHQHTREADRLRTQDVVRRCRRPPSQRRSGRQGRARPAPPRSRRRAGLPQIVAVTPVAASRPARYAPPSSSNPLERFASTGCDASPTRAAPSISRRKTRFMVA